MMIRTDRAVEVLHNGGTDKDPDWSVGSGYLIGGRLVLTAAHNVGAGECLVRMVDGSEHPAVVRRRGEEIRLDLAVLELTGDDAPDLGEGVRYAIVSQEHAERLQRCTGLGFPQFKEDKTRPQPGSGKALRNIEQLDGEIPTAAGALANLLTFRVSARPREHPLPTGVEEFGGSPWQGVSGTVVFARDESFGERAVGVVTEHHLAEGGSALTLVPIGAIGVPGVLPAKERQAWWDLLGVPDPAALPKLSGLSSRRRPHPPAPPSGAVARGELAAAILAALRDGPAPLVALTGGPGFGKSVLARLVAAAVDAPASSDTGNGGERWCPGGVVWLDMGQEPDLSRLLAHQLTDLTGQSAGGRSVGQLASELGEELAARRCLLVLDDVWPPRTSKVDVVGLVLSRIENVPRLVTTRSMALLDTVRSARRIDVQEMDPGDAYALLATALSEQATENEAAQLGEFARRLGRWPLLLGLAAAHLGRQVSGGVPLRDAVRDLAARYGEKGVTAFDARHADLLDPGDPGQRQRAVAAAVEASLGLLVAEDGARYRELAVFPPGQPIPVEVIAGLWAPIVDRYDTDDLLDELANLSLLSLNMRTRQVQVHDLLRDYLRPSDPQLLEALHRRLLQSWGDPQSLHDSYPIRWYAYHLDAAGDSDRLYALISPAWRSQVLSVTGALSDVVADVMRAAEHAGRQRCLPEELRCRLITTTLFAHAKAMPHPFLVILAKTAPLDRALGYATLLPPPDRDAALTAIASAIAHADPDHALTTAERIDEPGYKAQALASIAAAQAGTNPGRAGQLTDQAVTVSRRTHTRREFEGALPAIVAALAALARTDPDRALAATDRLPADKALVLADILPALAGADPDRALAAADHIDALAYKAEALARIAAALASTDPGRARRVADQALAAANSIDYPGYKVDALAGIAAALAGTDPDRALAAAGRMTETRPRAKALAGIAAALAGTDPDRALAAADRIYPSVHKARALAEIAAALSGTDPGRAGRLADQALATVDLIDEPVWTHKPLALIQIASALGGPDPDRAVAAANRVDDPGFKAEALAGIAAALSGTDPGRAGQLADRALAAAGLCDHHGLKVAALVSIIAALAALAHTDAEYALAAADRIDDPGFKARALAGIAAVLADTDPGRASQLADQAAAAARVDPETKARALAGIATVLAGTDPGRAGRLANQALAAADRIDEQPADKARALADIAAKLAGIDAGLALSAADRIEDPEIKWKALAAVAAVLASTDAEYALAAADRIDDPGFKAWALAGIAAVLADTDPGRASQLADQAAAAARVHRGPEAKALAIAGVAAALAVTAPSRAGELADQALAVAKPIRGHWSSAKFLADTAAALASTDPGRAGRLADQALADAKSIDSSIAEDTYREELADIAPAVTALARTDPGRARELANQVLAAADRLDANPGRDKGWALVGIIAAFAGTDPGLARQLADQAAARMDSEYDASALAGIAATLAGTDPGRARQLADQALVAADRTEHADKAEHLAGLTVTLANVDPGLALATADRIEDPWYEAQALANLAEAWTSLTPSSDAVPVGHAGIDLAADGILTRARALDPAAGTDVWWRLAQLFVTRATSGPQRNDLVDAVLAANEW